MQLLASGPIIAGAALLSSCAGTIVGRISNPAYQVDGRFSDTKAQGIRYYESAPFLLVYSDGKGGLVSKLLFLPDLTQKRTVDPYALLASNNTTLTFTTGVLTQGKTVVDETIVPKAVVGALEKAAGVALKAFNVAGGGASGNLPPPLLFKIILKNGSPIIRVTPQANGTMTVDVEYLPDPDNTYTLKTSSFLSSYTLDVQRENGMLKSVSLDAKSDTVAAASVESAGNLVKARAEAASKEDEAQATAAKEQMKAIEEAGLALAIADAKVKTLEGSSGATDQQKLEARIAADEALAKQQFLTKAASAKAQGAMNVIDGEAFPQAAGPVLFRVVPIETDDVKLVAFDGPTAFATSSPTAPASEPAGSGDLSIALEGPSVLRRTGAPLSITLTTDRALKSFDLSRSKLIAIGTGATNRIALVTKAEVSTGSASGRIVLTLSSATPPGRYSLSPSLILADDQPGMTDPIDFTVQR